MEIKDTQSSLSRRDLIKAAMILGGMSALSACGGGFPSSSLTSQDAGRRPHKRLAIIGGGIGALATAYFCDDDWNIAVFEAREKIGGHCDSIPVDYQGVELSVDLGAQFFQPDTHPMYVALLEDLGLYDVGNADRDAVLEAEGSISIFSFDRPQPYFVSKRALLNPFRALDFAIYTRAARKLVLRDGSYELSLADWIRGLPASFDFKYRLLTPWMAAMIGCSVELAEQSSARSLLETFALAFPHNFLKPATTFNSKIGVQGNLQCMMDRCKNVRIHTKSPVRSMEKSGGAWYLETSTGRQGPFDQVVINAQPQHSKRWLTHLAGAEPLVAILDRYRYFDARIVIHEDPAYVPKDRRNWGVYNAGIHDGACEGSVWLGGIHEKIHGNPVDLFKSWAAHRQWEARRILGERRFQHPLITPDVIRATRALQRWQGHEGLWFAGQYTTGMDLQESALFSATRVAMALSPRSASWQRLQARLRARGKGHVNYHP